MKVREAFEHLCLGVALAGARFKYLVALQFKGLEDASKYNIKALLNFGSEYNGLLYGSAKNKWIYRPV